MNDGLVTVESRFPVSVTIDRLAAAADTAGLLVFARIDHAEAEPVKLFGTSGGVNAGCGVLL